MTTKVKAYWACSATDLAISSSGAIFVGHYDCHISVISEGVESTVAGSMQNCTPDGNGGQARLARLQIVAGVALDSAGNLFFSDLNENGDADTNQFIRVIYGAASDTDGDGYTDAHEGTLGEDHTAFCRIMRSDVSRDGLVNVADLGRVASQFGANPEYPRYDQNADGVINPADLGLTATVFGKRPAACP